MVPVLFPWDSLNTHLKKETFIAKKIGDKERSSVCPNGLGWAWVVGCGAVSVILVQTLLDIRLLQTPDKALGFIGPGEWKGRRGVA